MSENHNTLQVWKYSKYTYKYHNTPMSMQCIVDKYIKNEPMKKKSY